MTLFVFVRNCVESILHQSALLLHRFRMSQGCGAITGLSRSNGSLSFTANGFMGSFKMAEVIQAGEALAAIALIIPFSQTALVMISKIFIFCR